MTLRCDLFTLTAAGAVVLVATPAFAAQPAPASAQQSAPASFQVPADIAAAYETYRIQPIWTRNGLDEAAVAQLISILQRAPFDGFPEGPTLAAQVQAAADEARSGNAAALTTAEQVLSAAWVRYVRAISRPTQGMIYAVPFLQPHPASTEQILLTT